MKIKLIFIIILFLSLPNGNSKTQSKNNMKKEYINKIKKQLEESSFKKQEINVNSIVVRIYPPLLKIAQKENGYASKYPNYKAHNKTTKCIGAWQIRSCYMNFLGYPNVTYEKFIKNPNIFPPKDQLRAVLKLHRDYKKQLGLYFYKYVGKEICGIKITTDNIIYACHLAGPSNVIAFLESNGEYNPNDGASSIKDFLVL